MTEVRFLAPAETEMHAAAHFYNSQLANLGKSFLTEVRRVTNNIARMPLLGKKVRGDIRRRIIRRFPYALLYRIEENEIIIIAVMHLKRNPDYWHNRAL